MAGYIVARPEVPTCTYCIACMCVGEHELLRGLRRPLHCIAPRNEPVVLEAMGGAIAFMRGPRQSPGA